MSKIGVAVCGATGSVGQRFIELLQGHPWFELKCIMASERSEGKKYSEAVQWIVSSKMPEQVKDMEIKPLSTKSLKNE
ncbi:MAG: aspartate-semialdehyde dehydrogenase, partial [Candidatus Odinarchaeota archaeon]